MKKILVGVAILVIFCLGWKARAATTPSVVFNSFTLDQSGLSSPKIIHGGTPIGVSCVQMRGATQLTCVVLAYDNGQ
jgi:hypothetical protein